MAEETPAAGMKDRIVAALRSGPFAPEQLAECVLIAIREPTRKMVDAVYESDLDINFGYLMNGQPYGPEDVWRVMVDAEFADAPVWRQLTEEQKAALPDEVKAANSTAPETLKAHLLTRPREEWPQWFTGQ